MKALPKIQQQRGAPQPLGATCKEKGINFALFSEHASQVTLCIFSSQSKQPLIEIPLNPEIHKTGHIWHILLIGLPSEPLEYAYRVDGPKDIRNRFNPDILLSDPYARGLNTSHIWGKAGSSSEKFAPKGRIIFDSSFDWQETQPPRILVEDLIIYEMHVRSFTQDASSKTQSPGTFLGIIEKIPYLKNLGVNAIELMPIFEFNECASTLINPKTNERLKNVWGYSTINFFSPMNRYASNSGWNAALNDIRLLVREMHKNGIEVFLDVVYNHTAEGNQNGPHFSFRGIDNQIYYMLNPQGEYLDFTGTGNTFNANHPVVTNLIIDSLRYWVEEMHIDGFRFDLASCLTRDEDGTPLKHPPVILAMTGDPVLAGVKMIAEAWDAGGLYQVGSFPGEGRWFEWNGKFRDVVRKFIKGTDGESGEFAQVMSGSEDLYGQCKRPYHSLNFVTAHDGYTLHDLVSYQSKHNEANGEENRDGANNNESWNCGVEGETHDNKILLLRKKQMRNFQAALMLSLGTPMMFMGDEYGHTRHGNNNPYCQDNKLNWFLWDHLEKHADFARFHRLMIQFRKENCLLTRKEFLKESDVQWHGHLPLKPDWSPNNRFLAWTLTDNVKFEPLYIAFNADFKPANIHLPLPPKGKTWYRIIDTSLSSPEDFCEQPQKNSPLKLSYMMPDHSALVAKAL